MLPHHISLFLAMKKKQLNAACHIIGYRFMPLTELKDHLWFAHIRQESHLVVGEYGAVSRAFVN